MNSYEKIKQENSNYIVIEKQGIFYMVFGIDTYILNYLFNYQIKPCKKTLKVGFSNIEKVRNELCRLKINYIIINGEKRSFKNNNYTYYSCDNIIKMNKIRFKIKDIIIKENNKEIIEKILKLL